jgi:thiamine-phosphate pyrophosphorylase
MIVLPRLYPVLDAGFFAETNALLAAAEELASAGGTLIQYRNKSGNPRVMLEQARELRKLFGSHPFASDAKGRGTQELRRSTRAGVPAPHMPPPNVSPPHTHAPHTHAPGVSPPSVRLIINDRADLCLAADFDGVHVGQDDLSPESVRKMIGPDRWLGVSTHNPDQLGEADATSADYLAIGPVFATSSKDRPDPVVGLEGVRRARALTRKPLVAIGGITRANAASVIEAGADSVAVISDLLRDPRKSAEEFFRILR